MKRLKKPNWQKQKEQNKKKRFLFLIGAIAVSLIVVGFGSVYVLSETITQSSFFNNFFLAEPEIKGNKIYVRRGGNFQAALDRAKSGDTIYLEAGATFKGAFKLPRKSGNEFITIRTSASDSKLPLKNKRLDPKKYANVLPKLQSNVKGKPVIFATNGAHHFRFIGIEFMPTIEGLYNIIEIGSGEETKIADLPHHIEFDRVYVHGDKKVGQRRGIAANGRNIKIKNSYISEIKKEGFESQAIAAWATDGPIEITNNYLEAAGMSILFGGAGSPLKLIPSNCIVKANYLNKPLEWRGKKWVVKNIFEIKNGRNIKVTNNLMTHNWTMGQTGTAILFTTRADNDNAIIEDIEFSNNIVRGSGNALNIYGSEGDGGKNLVVRNNLFDDINGEKWDSAGRFITSTDWDGLIVENNTVIQTGNITMAHSKPVKNFVFRNNIIYHNEYGIMGDNSSPGKKTLSKYFPSAKVSNNIIIGSDSSMYGRQNFYPSSKRQIGFVDFKNYILRDDSPYKKRGFQGKSIGANLDPKTVGGN